MKQKTCDGCDVELEEEYVRLGAKVYCHRCAEEVIYSI